MRLLGIAILVIVYGMYHVCMGLLQDDADFDRVDFGLKIVLGVMGAMMIYVALYLIFGGVAS